MRVVVAPDLPAMVTALRAAYEQALPLRLLTPPEGAAAAGPDFYLAAFAAACRQVPGARADLVIDCDDDPGLAIAALRAGAKRLRAELAPALRRKLASLAAAHGACLESLSPPL